MPGTSITHREKPLDLELQSEDKVIHQEFGDGGFYEGENWLGMRHGKGTCRWSNGQVYKGYFFYDQMHGPGRYSWPDGRSYVGYFYADEREGYGTVLYASGDTFEGLFHRDKLFGPGVATYYDGRRDTGLWFGAHLLQLPISLHDIFNTPYLQEVLRLFPVTPGRSWHPNKELRLHYGYDTTASRRNQPIKHFQLDAAFFDQENSDFQNILFESFLKPLINTHSSADLAHHDKWSDMNLADSEILRNSTKTLIDIQKHTRKMQSTAQHMAFDPDSVLMVETNEEQLKNPGEKECQVVEFFKAASAGDLRVVQELLFSKGVNVDVCDIQGLTPLMAATMRSRQSVMNLLLDFGANVHHVTNRGFTATEICFAMYHCFVEKFNTWQENDLDVEFIFAGGLSFSHHSVISGVLKSPTDFKNLIKPSALRVKTSSIPIATGSSKIFLPKKPASTSPAAATGHQSGHEGKFRLEQADQKVSFKSTQSMKKVPISILHHSFLRAGEQLFAIPRIFQESDMDAKPGTDVPLFLAWLKAWQSAMKRSLLVLLSRGGDWKKIDWPQPFLFTAVRGLDEDLIRSLVALGANVNGRMVREGKSVTPLLVACKMSGIGSVKVVEALLEAGADPNAAEINIKPEKVAQINSKRKKKEEMVQTGRCPIQVVCLRDIKDATTEKLLEILICYKARADISWNNSSPLISAIQLGNIKMVRALLEAGCDVNQDLGTGHGNALCLLATLATAEGFLIMNKNVDAIKKLMELLLENADFTIKIPLPESLLGSPLDYASHLYAKQSCLNPEIRAVLDDLRKTILKAYKLATQISVLRRRKLMLAGFISPQLTAKLQRFPSLIDGPPDASLMQKLSQLQRPFLQSIANIRERIEELNMADIIKDGQKLRPTLIVPYREPTLMPEELTHLGYQTQDDAPNATEETKNIVIEEGSEEDGEDMDENKRESSTNSLFSDETEHYYKATKDDRSKDGKAYKRDARNLAKEETTKKTGNVDLKRKKSKNKGEGEDKTKDKAKKIKKAPKNSITGGKSYDSQDTTGQAATKEEIKSETSLNIQNHETEEDAKLSKKKEKETKKAPQKERVAEGKKGIKGKNKKRKEEKEEKRQTRQGKHQDGLIMENHVVYETKDAHMYDPDYELPHSDLPHEDLFDPDHVNLIVPAVHLCDKEGDPIPLDHTTMEYKYCSNCAKSTGVGLFACPRCNGVFYDSKECQATHWSVHQKKCQEIYRRKEHNADQKKNVLNKKARQKLNSRQEAEYRAGGGGGRQGKANSNQKFKDGHGGKFHHVGAKPRKLGLTRGVTNTGHTRTIRLAQTKTKAEWMEAVRGINCLRMNDEMHQSVNSHYLHLLEKGLNLAEARDIVELKNAEYYAAIAFHRHVTITDLLQYTEKAKQDQDTIKLRMMESKVITKTASTFFAFEKVQEGNFSFI